MGEAMPGGRVLIIDDAAGQGTSLRSYLQDLLLEVELATSPTAAIEKLRRRPVHAVLCALARPGGGGTAVLRAVRGQGWPTPIILVTGDGEEPRGPEWMAAGAFDVIKMPVEPKTLWAVLGRTLRRSGWRAQTSTPPLGIHTSNRV